MPNNSTSRMFLAFSGVSASTKQNIEEATEVRGETPRLVPTSKSSVENLDMQQALTYALGFSTDKKFTPLD